MTALENFSNSGGGGAWSMEVRWGMETGKGNEAGRKGEVPDGKVKVIQACLTVC